MKRVVLFGTSPSVIMAYYQLVEDENYEVVGFTTDKEYLTEKTLFELPVIPFDQIETTFAKEENALFIPIGYHKMNKVREQKYIQAKKMDTPLFPTFIQPLFYIRVLRLVKTA